MVKFLPQLKQMVWFGYHKKIIGHIDYTGNRNKGKGNGAGLA